MQQYICSLFVKNDRCCPAFFRLLMFGFCVSLFVHCPSSLALEKANELSAGSQSHTWLDDIKWHGFVSQNFVATDENNYLGSSTDGSFKSNEAGLNASWRANESLQFSLQGIYKQIGNAEPKGGRIDYAIIDWRALDTFSNGAGFRLGRLKNPYGFFNETRDVAATNISILLPESIYIDYLSQFFHSSDSFAFYSHHEASKGTFTFNAQYGRPILNPQVVRTLIATPNSSGSMSDSRGGFLRLIYEDGAGLWRSALSYIRFRSDFTAGASDPFYINDGHLNIEQLTLSLEFNFNDWQILSEILRRNVSAQNIFAFDNDIFYKSLGYYAQVAYSVSPLWKVYLRRDEIFRYKNDRHGNEYIKSAKLIDPSINAHSVFAKDTTLGFRYSPSFEWSFAMEVHQVDGTFWLPNLENPNMADQKRYWNMFLAQVAYRF